MAERFKFNDEEENIDENDNQQDDLEKNTMIILIIPIQKVKIKKDLKQKR